MFVLPRSRSAAWKLASGDGLVRPEHFLPGADGGSGVGWRISQIRPEVRTHSPSRNQRDETNIEQDLWQTFLNRGWFQTMNVQVSRRALICQIEWTKMDFAREGIDRLLTSENQQSLGIQLLYLSTYLPSTVAVRCKPAASVALLRQGCFQATTLAVTGVPPLPVFRGGKKRGDGERSANKRASGKYEPLPVIYTFRFSLAMPTITQTTKIAHPNSQRYYTVPLRPPQVGGFYRVKIVGVISVLNRQTQQCHGVCR